MTKQVSTADDQDAIRERARTTYLKGSLLTLSIIALCKVRPAL